MLLGEMLLGVAAQCLFSDTAQILNIL